MIVTFLDRHLPRAAIAALFCLALLAFAPGAATAAKGSPRYPAGATRPAFLVSPGQLGPSAHAASRRSRKPKRKRAPSLHGNPARALAGFQAMQKAYYIAGSGLYEGEPFPFLRPFSQAFAAPVTLSNVPGLRPPVTRE